MDMDDTLKLYIITVSLSIVLLLILCFNHLTALDQLWIYSVLFTHVLFVVALKNNKRNVLHVIHCLIFIFPVVSILTNNVLIKLASILVIIVIQTLWVHEKRCILNRKDESFGYGNVLNICLIVFTPALSLHVGYELSKFNYGA